MASSSNPSSLATPASSDAAASTHPRPSAKSTVDPILRNALRYTISAREYALLHRYILSRSRLLKRRLPTVDTVQKALGGGQPYHHVRERPQKKADNDQSATSGLATPRERQGSIAGSAGDDYNARAVRHSIRVFLATGAVTKLWHNISARLMAKNKE